MIICKNCKTVIDDDMQFCPECGAKYIVKDKNIYSNEDCPVELVEQYLFVVDGKPQIQLSMRNKTKDVIDACVVVVRGKNQFGDEVEETKQILADLNAFEGDVFGENKIFEPKDENMRTMEISVEKIAYENGTIWENKAKEELEKIDEKYNDEESDSYAVYDYLLSIYPVYQKYVPNSSESYEKHEEKYQEKKKIYLEKMRESIKSLDELFIPEGTEEIPDYMFSLSRARKKPLIHIPDSVEKIGNESFKNCHVDKIPENVLLLGFRSFEKASIDNFSLPSDMTSPETESGFGHIFNSFEKCKIKNTGVIIETPKHAEYALNDIIGIEGVRKVIVKKPFDNTNIAVIFGGKVRKDLPNYTNSHANEYLEWVEINYKKSKKYVDPVQNTTSSVDAELKSDKGAVYGKYVYKWQTMEYGSKIVGNRVVTDNKYEDHSKKVEGLFILPPRLKDLYIPENINKLDLTEYDSDYLESIIVRGKKTKVTVDLINFPELRMIYINKLEKLKLKNYKKSNLTLCCSDSSKVPKGLDGLEIIETDESPDQLIEIIQKRNKYWEEHIEEKEELQNKKNQLISDVEKRGKETKEIEKRIEEIQNKKLDVENKLEKTIKQKEKIEKINEELSIFKRKEKKENEQKIASLTDEIARLKEQVKTEVKEYKESVKEELETLKSKVSENDKHTKEAKNRIDEINDRFSNPIK